jgi:hypothetical protein
MCCCILVMRWESTIGYRVAKHVTDKAVAAGCGVHRWDGFTMHDDWHMERAVAAIRSAAEVPGNPAVADALAAAVDRREARERVLARKRKQEETAAACRQEEEAVISALQLDLRSLRNDDPEMGMLTAVEYITGDPGHRLALYRRCSVEDRSVNGMAQDDGPLNIAAPVARDLALLERRARAEGFQAYEEG